MAPAELTIVAPTFNERDNVAALVEKIAAALPNAAWEIVFVDDDSTDGTGEALRALARADARVRAIRRIGRRGLASAVIEGWLSSSAPYLAVIDADLQHDETLLSPMLARLKSGATDIAIASRYVQGGRLGDWAHERRQISGFATLMARMAVKADVTDPMSGFFMLKRETLDGALRGLSQRGYKLLLDVLASSPTPLRIAELPYQFRLRTRGESKLDSLVALEYLELLLDKTIGRFVPTRFVMFLAIGGAGVAVHFAVLTWLFETARQSFTLAQASATFAAMTFNFFLNNWLTYRDRRLKGYWRVFAGLLSFYAVCGFGAIGNVGIANYLFTEQKTAWPLAALAGILVGAVWNYAASNVFTWRGK